jgi:hypothetical protein
MAKDPVAAYRNSLTSEATSNTRQQKKSANIHFLDSDVNAIADRFSHANQQLIGATTMDELIKNAWQLDRMTEHVNAVRKIERAVSVQEKADVTKLRRQMESLLDQRIRQHNSQTKHVIWMNDLNNALEILDAFK